MSGIPYPPTMSTHGPARSLDAYLAELTSRHDKLSAALRKGTRIANTVTLAELRDLHSRIRAVEDEIDARAGC